MNKEITVRHPGNEPLIFQSENGILRLSALRAYFPHALGLKYHKTNKCYCVTLQDDLLKLPPDVDTFDLFLAERKYQQIYKYIYLFHY